MFFASVVWNLAGCVRQEFDGIFFFFLTALLPSPPAVFLFHIKMFCFIMLPCPQASGVLWHQRLPLNFTRLGSGDFRIITNSTISESLFVCWGPIG